MDLITSPLSVVVRTKWAELIIPCRVLWRDRRRLLRRVFHLCPPASEHLLPGSHITWVLLEACLLTKWLQQAILP